MVGRAGTSTRCLLCSKVSAARCAPSCGGRVASRSSSPLAATLYGCRCSSALYFAPPTRTYTQHRCVPRPAPMPNTQRPTPNACRQLPDNVTASSLLPVAERRGVTFLPGSICAPTASPTEYARSVRLCFAYNTAEHLVMGVKRLTAAVAEVQGLDPTAYSLSA